MIFKNGVCLLNSLVVNGEGKGGITFRVSIGSIAFEGVIDFLIIPVVGSEGFRISRIAF